MVYVHVVTASKLWYIDVLTNPGSVSCQIRDLTAQDVVFQLLAFPMKSASVLLNDDADPLKEASVMFAPVMKFWMPS